MTKRIRSKGAATARVSFDDALRVLLCHNSDFVSGYHDHVQLVALLQTSQSTKRVVEKWAMTTLQCDVTRQHELRPILVRCVNEEAVPLSSLLMLLRFRYVTRVQIPIPRERHQLPMDVRTRLQHENVDVARVVKGRASELYAACSTSSWGIYAARSIESGEYLGEYTGELITSAEASRRYHANYDHARLNYVLALREQTAATDEDGVATVVRTNVDASWFGCYTRLYNHSCEPTLRVEALRVDSFIPRLVFFAKRQLQYGEQLTFDYGSSASVFHKDLPAASSGHPGVPCLCGAAGCRGMLPFDSSL